MLASGCSCQNPLAGSSSCPSLLSGQLTHTEGALQGAESPPVSDKGLEHMCKALMGLLLGLLGQVLVGMDGMGWARQGLCWAMG